MNHFDSRSLQILIAYSQIKTPPDGAGRGGQWDAAAARARSAFDGPPLWHSPSVQVNHVLAAVLRVTASVPGQLVSGGLAVCLPPTGRRRQSRNRQGLTLNRSVSLRM